MLSSGIAYPASLTQHVIASAADSPLVKDQLANPSINVMNGEPFGTEEASAFDMASLFSIDTDQLKSAFQFDTSKLNFDRNARHRHERPDRHLRQHGPFHFGG